MMAWRKKARQPPSTAPGLTREHVVWAYRLLLDREPENEARVTDKLAAWQTTRELRIDFMTSAEFRDRNPDLALTHEPTIVIKEIAPGLRLFLDLADQVVGMGILRGTYEAAELAFVRGQVADGDTVLDIGANVGWFTLHMAALVGARGKVYAFEPVPALVDLLARSVAENQFTDRIEVVGAAVGDRPGRRVLFSGSDPLNRSGSYLVRSTAPPDVPGELLEVPVVQLDAQPLRRPVSFLKIDVEGAEPLALRGAEGVLREDRPTILAELNPTQLARVAATSPAGFLAEMAARGYTCHTVDGQRLDGKLQLAGQGIQSVVFAPR